MSGYCRTSCRSVTTASTMVGVEQWGDLLHDRVRLRGHQVPGQVDVGLAGRQLGHDVGGGQSVAHVGDQDVGHRPALRVVGEQRGPGGDRAALDGERECDPVAVGDGAALGGQGHGAGALRLAFRRVPAESR